MNRFAGFPPGDPGKTPSSVYNKSATSQSDERFCQEKFARVPRVNMFARWPASLV